MNDRFMLAHVRDDEVRSVIMTSNQIDELNVYLKILFNGETIRVFDEIIGTVARNGGK